MHETLQNNYNHSPEIEGIKLETHQKSILMSAAASEVLSDSDHVDKAPQAILLAHTGAQNPS